MIIGQGGQNDFASLSLAETKPERIEVFTRFLSGFYFLRMLIGRVR